MYRDDMFLSNLWDGFLDDDKTIKNYCTSKIHDNELIDTGTTGMEYYNRFLTPYTAAYLRRIQNLVGNIEYISPKEYFEECSRYIYVGNKTGYTYEKLVDMISHQHDKLDGVRKVIDVYNTKLCMPMIDYANRRQEGFHRLFVIAEKLGWDYKVPILVVKHL